jgi:DNA polymerase-4
MSPPHGSIALVRSEPSVLHLDLDAFFAAVEQRDKPSLRGKPVVVGGLGPRGVVATASYEAREFGVRSAMPTAQARARCPHAAYLTPRTAAYRAVSDVVMNTLRELSPVIEPLSLDEAFVDLAAASLADLSTAHVEALGALIRRSIKQHTGLTASVGAGTSKLIAKVASEAAKPDGLLVVAPGEETALLHPLPVRALPGVGPVTAAHLARLAVHTIGDLAALPADEVVRSLGDAHGRSLAELAQARDDRAVSTERESKSISVEDTFDNDITNPALLAAIVTRMAEQVASRLTATSLSARTITLKARLHDFTTLTRSATLPGPTDNVRDITRLASQLLADLDTRNGIRLMGVGVSGITDWVQYDLFAADPEPNPEDSGVSSHSAEPASTEASVASASDTDHAGALGGSGPHWAPGKDVVHAEHGRGWIWGSGLGRVTVRFETADTLPGPIHTFRADDPALKPTTPSS